METNEYLEHLFRKVEEARNRPWDETNLKESRNNLMELERLTDLFTTECLRAFRAGKRFSE